MGIAKELESSLEMKMHKCASDSGKIDFKIIISQ
jgi:hypothetical protein